MRKLLLIPLLLTGFLPALTAQSEFQKLCAGLGQNPRQHPYLLFSAGEKPAILQRIKQDRRSAEVFEKFLLEGRRLLNATVEHDEPPPREMHTRYVGADDYRRFVTQHLDAAFTLAFLYQMPGDEKYVAKAFEHANVVCAQESWVQSAHYFDVIYSRVWPYGVKDDIVVFTYDITASATSQRMAYIYDWLYSALTKPQRDRIRGALLEKAITRVRGNYEFFWWATAYKCNWSGICHTGLGLAALALLDDDPQLTDVVARSCEGISAMLDHIGDDGGWQEGRGYWSYGLGESLRFMDAIKRLSGGKIDLFKHRSLTPHPLDFGLFGMTAGFGDGSGNAVGDSYTMNKLAQESGDPRAAWYVKNFVRTQESIFDLIWPATSVKPEKPAESSKFFPSIDWAVMRKDFGPDFMTVATKAGMNDDPHHGHLDCGTFNLTWQGFTFVGEVPRTPYDEKYFGAMRWDYLEARTSGHNCVMVNGEEQIVAKLKDQPWREGIGGHITSYTSEPGWAAVTMDPSHAYSGKEMRGWNRAIVLDKDQNIVVVLDRVRCAVGANVEVRFHPGVDMDVGKDRVILRASASSEAPRSRQTSAATRVATRSTPLPAAGEHRYIDVGSSEAPAVRTRRSDLEMQPLFSGEYSLIQGRQPDSPITQEPQLTWVPYFSTVIKAPTEDNVIASVFYPTDLKAREGSGGVDFKLGGNANNPTVSYRLNGKTVTYTLGADKVTRVQD